VVEEKGFARSSVFHSSNPSSTSRVVGSLALLLVAFRFFGAWRDYEDLASGLKPALLCRFHFQYVVETVEIVEEADCCC
jgi:hypothetical protein